MELLNKLKTDKKTRNAYTVTCAFVAFYCWYTAFWDNINFENHVLSLDLTFNFVLALFQASCVVSVILGFFFLKGKYLSYPRPLWIILHISAFLLTQLLMLAPIKELLIFGAITSGLCIGLIAYRLFFALFFYISKSNPVKEVAVAYIFIRIYVYTYAIVPVGNLPVLFFIIQAATLFISLTLSIFFKESNIEIRYSLVENKIGIRDAWPALVFVSIFQICLSMYQGIIVPQMPKSFWLDCYQIIPSAITFFCLLYFSRFFTITNTVRLFLITAACGFIAFLALEGNSRLLVDTFIQPAYLFADVFFIWLIYSIFFTYGSKYLKLRLFLCLNAAIHYLSLILVKATVSRLMPEPKLIIVAFPLILALFFLVPAIDSYVKKINAQREYIENQQNKNILLPPEHPPIIEIRNKFLNAMSFETILTQREQDVLAYLIADQSEDVLAYFMGISLTEARNTIKSILNKCCAATKAELIMNIGRQCVAASRAADIEKILLEYNLTAREKEVCGLLIKGKAVKEIAAELFISFSTAHAHYKAIYKKLNVNSRVEMMHLFMPKV